MGGLNGWRAGMVAVTIVLAADYLASDDMGGAAQAQAFINTCNPRESAYFVGNELRCRNQVERPRNPVPNSARPRSESAAQAEARRRAEANRRQRAEADARWRRLQAQAQRTRADRQAAQQQYERRVREAELARQQHARDLARHRGEVARADAARLDYQRRLEEHRRLIASGDYRRRVNRVTASRGAAQSSSLERRRAEIDRLDQEAAACNTNAACREQRRQQVYEGSRAARERCARMARNANATVRCE